MDDKCKVCGKEDLFSAVTGEGVCSICTMKFFGGGQATANRIKVVRSQLNLCDDEYLQQDHGAEAAHILGRRL